MKKLCVSAGLIVAGAASIQSVSGQDLDVISPKAWNVAGTLRGFYDDNYNISGTKRGSSGFEVSPSVAYNLPLQQTDMGIRYTYGLYYYQDRQDLGLNPIDQTHQVDLWLDHAINERWHLNFTDTFASGQEPELLTPAMGVQSATPYRVNGNNIGNHAKISLDTQWTPLFGTSLHYANDFYNYDNSGGNVFNDYTAPVLGLPILPLTTPGNSGGKGHGGGSDEGYFGEFSGNSGAASLAALLDRVEQNLGLDANWTLSPTTKFFVGDSFGVVNYIGGGPIAVFNYLGRVSPGATEYNKGLVYSSDTRNFISDNLYAGLNYQLTQNLSLMGDLGVEYIDSYNNPLGGADTSSWSPTANVSLTYTYTTGSYVQLGINQGENSTDIVRPASNGSLTEYQFSTVVFADVNQAITEKLMATAIARYAYSTFQGGFYGSEVENDYSLGLNLSYQITRNFSAEVGYNYDDLESNVPGQQYGRNRVYIGVGANY